MRERATSGVKSKRDHSPDVKVETPAGPSAPHINLLPDVRMIDPKTGSSRVAGAPAVDKVEDDDLIADEEELVEALLLSQRARIPIALAVTQDYSGAPFKVPRGAVVLGWFWLVQAWVSKPNIHPTRLRLLTRKAGTCTISQSLAPTDRSTPRPMAFPL